MENKLNIPTEIVELPSKGLIYPESSPLSKGEIEMKYMTAKKEDILTNQNYINKGTVLGSICARFLPSPDPLTLSNHSSITSNAHKASASENSYFLVQPSGVYLFFNIKRWCIEEVSPIKNTI